MYVDDVLVAGNDMEEIKALKGYLQKHFIIKDIGDAKYFLVPETAKTIYINHYKYALDIIDDVGLLGAKSAKTAMVKDTKLTDDKIEELEYLEPYKRLIGKLLYLNFTRPDIHI